MLIRIGAEQTEVSVKRTHADTSVKRLLFPTQSRLKPDPQTVLIEAQGKRKRPAASNGTGTL